MARAAGAALSAPLAAVPDSWGSAAALWMDPARGAGLPYRTRASASTASRLHERFCILQQRAREVQERFGTEAVEVRKAEEVLEDYATGIATELRTTRDHLRHDRWQLSDAVQATYSEVCFAYAMWELGYELAVCGAPAVAPRLLHWHIRHFLEEDIEEWWKDASSRCHAGMPKDDPEFWEPLCRLALADCRAEVSDLLGRGLAKTDEYVQCVRDWLAQIPSMHQIDEARASDVEVRQAMSEIRNGAQRLIKEAPRGGHPITKLLKIYAGASREVFERGEDVASVYGRGWVEEMILALVWVFPDLRRGELGGLLRDVAFRRRDEELDDIDTMFFDIFDNNVAGMVRKVHACPDALPMYFTVHFVDMLFFAGRVPISLGPRDHEAGGSPRDFYLMEYAKHLCQDGRENIRLAFDYLRAAGAPTARRRLEQVAALYGEAGNTDGEGEEAVQVFAEYGISWKVSVDHCRRLALLRRAENDLTGCVRWACRGEELGGQPCTAWVSEILDEIASKDLEGLLKLFTPTSAGEALGADSLPPELGPLQKKSMSGRLAFFVQLARSRSMRAAGKPASTYLPDLIKLWNAGAVPSSLVGMVLEDYILPALDSSAASPVLGFQDSMLLMRAVETSYSDPLKRTTLNVDMVTLHRKLGECASRAILAGTDEAFEHPPLQPAHGIRA